MKKLLIAVSVMLLTMGAASAQNSFRGIVKYQLESTGKVDVKIPAEQSIVEVKVYDNQLRLGQTTQNGFKVAQAADFSPYISYLAANGIDLETYTGDGKFLIRDETSKEKLDSGYIVDTEPGHYYYENADETKEILGYTAKKLIMHRYDTPPRLVLNTASSWVLSKVSRWCSPRKLAKAVPSPIPLPKSSKAR